MSAASPSRCAPFVCDTTSATASTTCGRRRQTRFLSYFGSPKTLHSGQCGADHLCAAACNTDRVRQRQYFKQRTADMYCAWSRGDSPHTCQCSLQQQHRVWVINRPHTCCTVPSSRARCPGGSAAAGPAPKEALASPQDCTRAYRAMSASRWRARLGPSASHRQRSADAAPPAVSLCSRPARPGLLFVTQNPLRVMLRFSVHMV